MSDEGETSQSDWLLGRLQIVLAAVLWSTSGFFAKAPWFDGWPDEVRGLMLAFWRSFFAAVILVPLIRRPKWQWQLVPMVTCFAVMVWSFMSAIVAGPAANAIWLQYLSPAWVLVAGVALLGERVTKADLRMLLCCLTGVLLILFMEMRTGARLYATGMGVLSGVTFAGVVLSIRAMKDADPAWLITLNHSTAAIILSFWVWDAEGEVGWLSYGILGLFGVFQMSVPYVLFARGLRTTPSAEASVLTLVEPILVPVWVFLAWGHLASYEPPRWWTLLGGGLILCGLLVRYIPELKRWSQRPKQDQNISGGKAEI